MLKTKILKILSYWGISLGMVLVFLICGRLIDKDQPTSVATAQADQVEPQVLGASIDLRGKEPVGPASPQLANPIDDSNVSSKGYLVADVATGAIIAEKNSGQKEYVASLTKLLTGLVAYENIDINATATITPADIFSVSPVLGLKRGDTVKLLDLFNSMLVGSANDAALALSNHVEDLSGKNFVETMNAQAQSLGMSDSHFSNPLGFDSPGNYSTAADLLKLVLATQKISAFTGLGQKTEYSFEGGLGNIYRAKATDKLIGVNDEIQAVKTGFTKGAGQAMITKATQSGHSVYIIVLGSEDREADTLALKKQVFENTSFVVK